MSETWSMRFLLRDAGMLLLIAGISWGMGELTRAWRQPGNPSSKMRKEREDLTLEQFRAFVVSNEGLVLDGRPRSSYVSGHVPGAFSFPSGYLEGAYLQLKARLESDKSQAIAVYCSEAECESSRLVQRMLVALGFRNVAVFKGGWREWQKAGLPEEHGP